MSLKLGEVELIRHVVETIPSTSSEHIFGLFLRFLRQIELIYYLFFQLN